MVLSSKHSFRPLNHSQIIFKKNHVHMDGIAFTYCTANHAHANGMVLKGLQY